MNHAHNRLMKFLACCLVAMVFLGGCDRLRTKFVRKKKAQDQKDQIVPILEPEDYPELVYSSGQIYSQHYALWKIWYRDSVELINEKVSDKRQRYALQQMLVHMEAMSGVLQEEKKAAFNALTGEINLVDQAFNAPDVMRNRSSMLRRLKNVEKQMRSIYHPKNISKYLVQGSAQADAQVVQGAAEVETESVEESAELESQGDAESLNAEPQNVEKSSMDLENLSEPTVDPSPAQ